MRWLILFGILAAGLWFGWDALNSYMRLQAWFHVDLEKSQWALSGQGWEVLKYSWPSAVAGALAAATIIIPVLGFVSARATHADYEAEIKNLRAKLDASRENEAQAMAMAKKELKADIERLRAFEHKLEIRETNLEQERQALRRRQEDADMEVMAADLRAATAESRAEQAEKEASFARVKRDRAAGAFHRMKQKSENA
jgi:hypothetical protein